MSKKAPSTFFAALLLAFAAETAGAFTMEPMSALVSPSGAGSLATFRIKNDGAERVAIRLRVLSRETGPDGSEINGPADALFVVYPARLLVEPGSSAAAKVQWRGPAKLESERSFRFVAEQIAIDADASKSGASGIKVMFRYIASLYVGETSFAPDLVASASGALGPQGETGYRVEIRNAGTRHVIGTNLRVALVGDGTTFSSDELGALSGANYLPATARTIFIQSHDAIAGKSYEARIEYDGAY